MINCFAFPSWNKLCSLICAFFGKEHKEPKLNPQQCLFGHHLLPVHLQHITVSGNNVLYEVMSQWLHLDLRQLWISLFLSKFGFLSSSFFRSWRALGFVNLMKLRISRYYRYWNPHSKAESLILHNHYKHKNMLGMILNLPSWTPEPIIFFISGSMLIKAYIHLWEQSLFSMICQKKDNVPCSIDSDTPCEADRSLSFWF